MFTFIVDIDFFSIICTPVDYLCAAINRVMVVNPALVQLNEEKRFLLVPLLESGSAVLSRISPLILHNQAEFSAYSLESPSLSRFPLCF